MASPVAIPPGPPTKVALITGITGQDGAYLTEYLIGLGYLVHGIKRRASSFNTDRIDHLYQGPEVPDRRLILHYGDLTDSMNLTRIIQEVQPDEIYNLAAMSHVKVSFDTPEYTANADGIGTLRILEAVRLLGLAGKTKFYQASTSELYGLVPNTLQDEKTPFYPRSPYAAAKLYAYWTTVYYRDTHHIHASNGILFNHESPLRGETFVTRKITRGVSKIVLGQQASIQLGNLSSSRDWGHAKDYVRAMHMLMQQEKPGDYVIATGITTTVRDFVKLSFQMAGILLTFEGENENETAKIESVNVPTFVEAVGQDYLEAIQKRIGEVVVSVDKQYFRPTEVNFLRGNRGKAEKTFGWTPIYDLEHLCADMMQSDIKLMKKDALLKASGFQTMRYFE